MPIWKFDARGAETFTARASKPQSLFSLVWLSSASNFFVGLELPIEFLIRTKSASVVQTVTIISCPGAARYFYCDSLRYLDTQQESLLPS